MPKYEEERRQDCRPGGTTCQELSLVVLNPEHKPEVNRILGRPKGGRGGELDNSVFNLEWAHRLWSVSHERSYSCMSQPGSGICPEGKSILKEAKAEYAKLQHPEHQRRLCL